MEREGLQRSNRVLDFGGDEDSERHCTSLGGFIQEQRSSCEDDVWME